MGAKSEFLSFPSRIYPQNISPFLGVPWQKGNRSEREKRGRRTNGRNKEAARPLGASFAIFISRRRLRHRCCCSGELDSFIFKSWEWRCPAASVKCRWSLQVPPTPNCHDGRTEKAQIIPPPPRRRKKETIVCPSARSCFFSLKMWISTR